jgi:hypothetical protein
MMRRRLPAIKWVVVLLCGLMGTRLHAQAQVPLSGTSVPLSQYKSGMRFYFPDDSMKRVTRQMMPGYSHLSAGVMLYIPGIFETYDRLATKTFRLDSILSRSTYDMFGNKKSTLCFVLVNEQGTGKAADTIYYVFPVSSAMVLPGAILMDDVQDAVVLYKGKHYYAAFAIAIGGKKLKYQEVVITDVGTGTMYGPVRMDFRLMDKGVNGSTGVMGATTKMGATDVMGSMDVVRSIDVVTTGTNVLPVYCQGHLFTDYFQAANPRDAVGSISEENWGLICQGLVGEKMTSKQVVFALGKADKVQRTVTAGGKTEEWDYAGVQVFLERDQVIKVIYVSGGN